MFSVSQKRELAQIIEDWLIALNHPEMPKAKPHFTLHIEGIGAENFANILPNWMVDEDRARRHANPFNEKQAELMDSGESPMVL